MRLLMPFPDARLKLHSQVLFGVTINDAQTCALQDAEPRFDVRPPRAMHGREVHNNAGMMRSPCSDFLPVMRTHMVTHTMNRTDALVNLHIHCVEKGHAFPLPLPVITVSVDLAGTGVKGGTEGERARPPVLRRHMVGQVVGLSWEGRGRSGPRLQRGLLGQGEDSRIRPEGTGVESDQGFRRRSPHRSPRR
jgi:hypothetical protein